MEPGERWENGGAPVLPAPSSAGCGAENGATTTAEPSESPTDHADTSPVVTSACLFFGRENPVRKLCIVIARSWWLPAASMILTLTFCVMQCFWHPLEPTDSGINLAIDKASLGVTIAFTVEIVIKCLAWGFVLDDGESLGGAWEACTARLRGACALCLRAGSAPERDAQLDRLMSARRARNLQLPERPGPLPPPRPPELQRGQPSELLPPWPSGQMQPEASQQLSEQLEVEAPQQQQCRRDDYGRPSAAQPDVAGQQHTAPNGGVLDPAVTVVVVDGRASVDLTLPAGQPNGEPAAATAADGSAGGGAAQQPRQMSALERRRSRKWQRRRPFLRDGWNRLDFVVIIASWITFLPGVGNGAAAARSLRLLLALRSITLFPGMKACTTAVLHSLPMLVQICVATLFLMCLFAIIGLQFYQSTLHQNCFELGPGGQPLPFPPQGSTSDAGYTPAANEGIMCSTMNVWEGPQCPVDQVCLQEGQPPQYGQLNFNNLATGLVYNFFIITTLWWGMATSYLMEATVGWSFFFALLQVLIGWFLLSLVLAVLGDQYLEAMRGEKQQQREEEEEAEKSGVGVPVGWARRRWDRFAARAMACWSAPLPGLLGSAAEWRWRRWLRGCVSHWAFEAAVISSVLANTIVLGMPYYGMSNVYASRLNTANNILTFFFVAEAALKVSAWGRSYFLDPFNCYDFIVTAVALASFFIESSAPGSSSGGLSSLRAVRILRLLRLLTVLPALQRFLHVLVKVLLRTLAFFGIVALTVVLFAVLGMLVLGGKWDPADPGAPRLNFNSFGSSLVVVFDTMTGSLEDSVFYAMYKTQGWAVLYYMAVTVLGNFLILNLLIAILYELFLEESEGTSIDRAGPKDWLLMRKLRQLAASVGRRLSCCKTGLEPVLPNRGSPEPQLSPADKEAASPRGEPPGLAPLGSGGMDEEGADVEAASANGRTPVAADLRPYSQSSSSSFFKDAKDNPAATSRLSSFQSDPAGRAPAGSEPDTGDESGGGGGSAPAAAKVRRRVRAWLAWTVSCGPEWKGVQGEPLSTYQSRALWLLPPHSCLRQALFAVVDDKRFDWLVLLVILFNCGVMALETPGNSPHMADLLADMEWGCLAFYIAELVAKMLALGALADKGSYFRSPWNWLDFTVVSTSVLAELLAHVGWVEALRLLRVLRPLRLIARSKQMKAVVGCLVTSVMSMMHVLAVAVLVQLVFAILGMQLFMGEEHYCTLDTCCSDPTNPTTCQDVRYQEQCTGSGPDGTPCIWANTYYNFDNLWNSLVTLTVLMTGANWSDAMYTASDTVGQGINTQANYSSVEAIFFFAIYQCVAQFFIFNLFISVVLDAYNEQLERQGMGVMLTEGQKEWVKSQLHLLRDLPEKRGRSPRQPLRRKLHTLVMHPLFDWVMLAFIFVSGVVMSLQHFGQGSGWDEALQWTNDAFTILFCLESVIKLVALYPARYFGDAWNCFDFLITWASVPSIFISSGPAVGALRAIRALRILRAVKHATGLRRIATTLYITLPTLANAILVFSLFIFMFSVLGTQLFYGVHPSSELMREGQGMTVFFNFQNVGNAMMMLTNAATGDNWEQYQLDTMVQPPDCDPAADDCGSPLASLYWVPFMIVCSFLLLSIVLAVVVDAYTLNQEPPQVTPENFDQFKKRWSELDPAGVGFINVAELHGLLASIEYPLGYRGHPHGPQLQHHTEQLATSLLQVDDDGSIYYHEVMQALTARAAGISISSLGHRVQLELKEETRYRKERQRQRQQQLRRRQLQRQQRIQRAGGQGRGRSAERSARSAGTLSRLVESIGRGGGQAATTSPPPASGRLDRSGSAASAVAAASVSLSEAPSADGFAMAAAAADCSPHTPRSPLGADGM